MKKLLFSLATLLLVSVLNAQSLEKVIEKHLEAINADKLSEFKTLTIKGHMNMQGNQLDIQMFEKAPDKIKSVTNFNGMNMVQVVNGDRGYIINPMMGSNDPVPLTADQITTARSSTMLNRNILEEYKAGKMVLDGEESVEGKPAYRIKISAPEGTRYIFIDKQSFYMTQMRMDVNQMGNTMTVEIRMRDFRETEGVTMARALDTFMGGQLFGTAFYDSIEFNKEIDDSEFEIK